MTIQYKTLIVATLLGVSALGISTVKATQAPNCGLTPVSACQYSYNMTPQQLDLDALVTSKALTLEPSIVGTSPSGSVVTVRYYQGADDPIVTVTPVNATASANSANHLQPATNPQQ